MMKPSSTLMAAAERAELYFMGRPGSPSAVRRPRLVYRSGTWTALLGDSIDSGIAGSGKTVEEALGAFDRHYLDALHPPEADEQTRFSISACKL
jgi:hypothetical protein